MQDGCDEGLQLPPPISCLQVALDSIDTASTGLALPAMRMMDQHLSVAVKPDSPYRAVYHVKSICLSSM